MHVRGADEQQRAGSLRGIAGRSRMPVCLDLGFAR
jgi:hypothetical protein